MSSLKIKREFGSPLSFSLFLADKFTLVYMVNMSNPALKEGFAWDANQSQKFENLHKIRNYFKSDSEFPDLFY